MSTADAPRMPSLNPIHIDDSRWVSGKYYLSGTANTPDEVTIHYIDCPPPAHADYKGVILLIHGFPNTSYQYRHVITPIADVGYRVICPDYRGAGESSHPRDGYTKAILADDLHKLVHKHLGVKEKVHVVGQDIGGMVAHSYASRFESDTASVAWGECPQPGTDVYDKGKYSPGVWHFTFQWQNDLPEALVAGRERIYLKHFYDRLAENPMCISPADLDHYTTMFAQPGGMRSGFELYRAFHQDDDDNKAFLKKNGKCKVPAMALNGARSFLAAVAEQQTNELYENVVIGWVEHSGHWTAEENPADFTKKVTDFAGKHLQKG